MNIFQKVQRDDMYSLQEKMYSISRQSFPEVAFEM